MELQINVISANKTCFIDWNDDFLDRAYSRPLSNNYQAKNSEIHISNRDLILGFDDGSPLKRGSMRIISDSPIKNAISLKELQKLIDDDDTTVNTLEEFDLVDFLAVQNKNRDDVIYKNFELKNNSKDEACKIIEHEVEGKRVDRMLILFHGIDEFEASDIADDVVECITKNVMYRAIEVDKNPSISIWYSEKLR